jgi:adenylate cyclase
MALPRVERRLAAILAADVVGYSRLVERDEAATLAAIRMLRAELIDPLLAEHHGRIVKLMGDGAIVEFGSVVDAVVCAVAVQRAVAERQAGAADERIVFRIGINLGDVVIEGDDLLGDGINVAARLQQVCDPGGVLISGAAYDQLKGKLDLAIEPRGRQRLKNISEPVRIYRVRTTPAVAGKTRGATGWRARRPRWAAAVMLTLLVAVGLAAWLRPWQPSVAPASIARMAYPLPDKPSIAVLPFKNMSGEPGQDYFVDGLTDDLITDLSKLSGLFVIDRNSVFGFKGRDVEIREVAESLGVRYVIEGGVRRAGDEVRVNVQLVDATSGRQLWADRYDGGLGDVFGLQDRLVREISGALALNLTDEQAQEIARGQTNNLDAREAFQKGWEDLGRFDRDENAAAAAEFRRAIELDQGYGRAYAALGLTYFRACFWGWSRPLGMNRSQVCDAASSMLNEAKRHPSSLAHIAATYIDLNSGRHDAAFTEAARAIALDPNDPEAHIAMAWAMITTGRPQTGLEFIGTAMRLNPTYPNHYVLARGLALFAAGELDDAARVLAEAMRSRPGAIELAPPLAATYALLGRRREARELLLAWHPGASQEELDELPFAYWITYQWSRAGQEAVDRLIDGLIIAALPLDVTVAGLADALGRGGPFERARTARMLGRFGPRAAEAVPALVQALGDQSQVVRGAAIIALGRIGPQARAAIPALDAIQDDRLRSLAKDALTEIAGR